MLKHFIGILLLLAVVTGGAYLIVDWAFRHDMRKADAYCAQFDAKPSYTYRTRCICVTSDGRVVG